MLYFRIVPITAGTAAQTPSSWLEQRFNSRAAADYFLSINATSLGETNAHYVVIGGLS